MHKSTELERMNNLKKAAAEASTLFSRAKQFTGEKLGNAERTCYDPALENLIQRADTTKFLTERIISNTTSVLQPNPSKIRTLNSKLDNYFIFMNR